MVKKVSIRFQSKLLVTLMTLVFFIVVSLYLLHSRIISSRGSTIGLLFSGQNYDDNHDQRSYVIKTSTCSIPKTPIMPSYFRNEWRIDNIPDCGYEVRNFILEDDQEFIIFDPRESDEKCCLSEILPTINNTYSLSKCKSSEDDTISVKNKSMFVVKCNTSINVEATFPLTGQVQEKLDYWKNINDESKPPNILIIGIDSVSRLHAYRSLPKTLKLLKKMNFYEFKGYHSAGPSTLANFLPLLMGLTMDDVRSQCVPDFQSDWDDCPFIWKFLQDAHYVTSFIEDGEGSFNWGGLGGYSASPTDYYIRPLFQVLRDLRLKSFSPNATFWTEELYTDCVSSETVPEFVLRYTQRFVDKFSGKIPFFKFTWLAYPFHEKIFTLATLDEKLHEFFQLLDDEESNSVLENTLIIFLSDHGDRTSFFQTSSMEGFIERSLPPLFLRLPKLFDRKFPYHPLRLNLLKNTKRLTTPRDIHHTLLHIAQLFPPSDMELDNFEPVLNDRSSLFQPVSLDRTCESLNIPQKNCVCNVILSDRITTDLEFRKKFVKVLSRQLNKIVQNSKYVQICSKWFMTTKSIISIRMIGTTNNFTNYLVVFSATSSQKYYEDALFEARLQVSNDLTKPTGIHLVESLSRINSYKNLSFCIPFETDFDKDMKQFCVCKKIK